MPKGSVPRNTTANLKVSKKRLFDLLKADQNPSPKKMRPSQKEINDAFDKYNDASKYPSLNTSRKEADPSKQWYGKKAEAKLMGKIKEGTYSNWLERRAARDVRADPGTGPIPRVTRNPVKSLKQRAAQKPAKKK
jgi:hypothetical protein